MGTVIPAKIMRSASFRGLSEAIISLLKSALKEFAIRSVVEQNMSERDDLCSAQPETNLRVPACNPR